MISIDNKEQKIGRKTNCMDYKIRLSGWLIVVSIIIGTIPVVSAASLNIWPIDPMIECNDNTTLLWLENLDKNDILLQIRIFSWKQKQNTSLLEKQNDIVVSPPIVLIASGQKQLLRLVKIRSPSKYEEKAYRIIIDEIPRVNNYNDNVPKKNIELKFKMRYSIPLFVYGPNIKSPSDILHHLNKNCIISTPKLHYFLLKEKDKNYLHIRNEGTIHAKLSEVYLEDNKNKYLVSDGLLGYVLPGNEIIFPIDASLRGRKILTAQINERPEIKTIPFFNLVQNK
ncbi:MAG: fimbria/pilus periplasmic chaperone [Candidatus Dasytiphilus stammeri]